jgi:hypothetical protein
MASKRGRLPRTEREERGKREQELGRGLAFIDRVLGAGWTILSTSSIKRTSLLSADCESTLSNVPAGPARLPEKPWDMWDIRDILP